MYSEDWKKEFPRTKFLPCETRSTIERRGQFPIENLLPFPLKKIPSKLPLMI